MAFPPHQDDDKEVAKAAEEGDDEEMEKKSLPSSYEESPPHIMDHDYARPPSSTHDPATSAAAAGGEPFANDHGGYAKASVASAVARTKPPSSPPKRLLQPANQQLQHKKPVPAVASVLKKPVIPVKKWPLRSQREEFDVIYR